MNMHVQLGASPGAENPCLVDVPSVDIDQLQMRAIKILGAFELIGWLVETAMENKHLAPQVRHDYEAFFDHVGLVSSTFADLTCEMLDGLNRGTFVR